MNTTTSPKSNLQRQHAGGHVSLFPAGQGALFSLVTTLFFIWGMSNNLTDILVQQFKKGFSLSPLEAQLVQTAVFFGYFCMAIPAALLMQRRGYKFGIVVGLGLFGVGTLLFWPAAIISQYWLMLTALFFLGCGSATLETAANPFITQFGPSATAERRLNFAQVFNPLGTIVGVIIGTFFIFSGIELNADRVTAMQANGTYAAYLHSEIMRVVPTYVTLGVVVLALAVVIGRRNFPQAEGGSNTVERDRELVPQLTTLLRMPSLRAAVIAQFCYCGAQVATWSAFIPYVKQYTHTSERTAALYLTANLVALFLGRSVSTTLMRWISATRMLTVYAVINTALICVAILKPGVVGVAALVFSSFFMSIMFPTIFALGVKELGPETKLGGSLIVMSIVGAAVAPPLLGLIARDRGSYAQGYWVVLVCYISIIIYGFGALRRRVSVDAAPVVM